MNQNEEESENVNNREPRLPTLKALNQKRDFGKDYWPETTLKYQESNSVLLSYKKINFEIKKVKNRIGILISQKVIELDTQVIPTGDKMRLVSPVLKIFFAKIEVELVKVYNEFKQSCLKAESQCQLFIQSDPLGSVELFFLEKQIFLHDLEHLVDFLEANLNALYHLVRKLEKELGALSLKIWEKFLKKNSKRNSKFVKLARASEVLTLLEAYKVNLELLELNKRKILNSEISAKNRSDESKTFDTCLREFHHHIDLIQTKYKHHIRVWLRSHPKTTKIEISDQNQHKSELKLKSKVLSTWIDELHLESIPPAILKIHHKYKKNPKKMLENWPPPKERACYSELDAWMVIIHTMGFMLIYYGNIATSSDYAKKVGIPPAISPLANAVTAFAAFLSTFHYAFWIKKAYRPSYIISHFSLVLGVLLYYLSLTFESAWMLVVGRFLFGYGGGRVITKTFVTYVISPKFKNLWSSYLVAMTALSITGGAGISSLTEMIGEGEFQGTRYSRLNTYSGVIFVALLVFAVVMLSLFEDLPSTRIAKKSSQLKKRYEAKRLKSQPNDDIIGTGRTLVEQKRELENLSGSSSLQQSKIQSFKYSSVDKLINTESDQILDLETKNARFEGLKVINSTKLIKQYFPLYYLFTIFTVCKMTQEFVIKQIPIVLTKQHHWSSQNIGFALAALTPFTMTAAIIPGRLALKGFENKQMLRICCVLLLISLFLQIEWGYQEPIASGLYIVSSGLVLSLTFSTEVVMTALFPELQPVYIKKSYFNAGLLSGLGDTLGKTFGNLLLGVIKRLSGEGGDVALNSSCTLILIWGLTIWFTAMAWGRMDLVSRAFVGMTGRELVEIQRKNRQILEQREKDGSRFKGVYAEKL